ncbi:MAG: hypothetical protein LBQ42_09970 [Synergistaceae bacterium]|jgi:hypothetical protein|nr:hypothetical protein [Synergistaceae bacterium]
MSKKTVIFDFDGVIHSYVSGWKGMNVIPDAPNPDVVEAIRVLRTEGYKVVVVSTRCILPTGIAAIVKYLDEHGIVVDLVTAHKPPAIVTIDDRAIQFIPGLDIVSAVKNFKVGRERRILDVELLAKELNEGGRSPEGIEWNRLSENARESWRRKARYLLGRYDITAKN